MYTNLFSMKVQSTKLCCLQVELIHVQINIISHKNSWPRFEQLSNFAHFATPAWSHFLIKRMWNNASNLAPCSATEICIVKRWFDLGPGEPGETAECRILALTNAHTRTKVIWYGSASQKWLRRWRFHQIRAADIKERCVCARGLSVLNEAAWSESTFARAVHSRSRTFTETTAGCWCAVLKRGVFPSLSSFSALIYKSYRCSAVAELVKTAYHVFSLTLQIHTPGRQMRVLHTLAQKLTSCSRQHKW